MAAINKLKTKTWKNCFFCVGENSHTSDSERRSETEEIGGKQPKEEKWA